IQMDMYAAVPYVPDPENGSEGSGDNQGGGSGNNLGSRNNLGSGNNPGGGSGSNGASARANAISATVDPASRDALKPSGSLSLRLLSGGPTTAQPTKAPVLVSNLGWRSRVTILMGRMPQFSSLFSQES